MVVKSLALRILAVVALVVMSVLVVLVLVVAVVVVVVVMVVVSGSSSILVLARSITALYTVQRATAKPSTLTTVVQSSR